MNCLRSFKIKNKLESHKKLCENKVFCSVLMPSKEFNQNQISDQIPSIIYTDLESLIKTTDECKINSEKLSTKKLGEHILYGYSVSTI